MVALPGGERWLDLYTNGQPLSLKFIKVLKGQEESSPRASAIAWFITRRHHVIHYSLPPHGTIPNFWVQLHFVHVSGRAISIFFPPDPSRPTPSTLPLSRVLSHSSSDRRGSEPALFLKTRAHTNFHESLLCMRPEKWLIRSPHIWSEELNARLTETNSLGKKKDMINQRLRNNN